MGNPIPTMARASPIPRHAWTTRQDDVSDDQRRELADDEGQREPRNALTQGGQSGGQQHDSDDAKLHRRGREAKPGAKEHLL